MKPQIDTKWNSFNTSLENLCSVFFASEFLLTVCIFLPVAITEGVEFEEPLKSLANGAQFSLARQSKVDKGGHIDTTNQ